MYVARHHVVSMIYLRTYAMATIYCHCWRCFRANIWWVDSIHLKNYQKIIWNSFNFSLEKKEKCDSTCCKTSRWRWISCALRKSNSWTSGRRILLTASIDSMVKCRRGRLKKDLNLRNSLIFSSPSSTRDSKISLKSLHR